MNVRQHAMVRWRFNLIVARLHWIRVRVREGAVVALRRVRQRQGASVKAPSRYAVETGPSAIIKSLSLS